MRHARIGAVLYILWGFFHLIAACQEFALGAGLEPGLVRGKIYQGGWNLLFIALASIGIVVAFNWKNSKLGYWLNLALISLADIGFLIFIFLPGYVNLATGLIGPFFWVTGAIFSTMGIRGIRMRPIG